MTTTNNNNYTFMEIMCLIQPLLQNKYTVSVMILHFQEDLANCLGDQETLLYNQFVQQCQVIRLSRIPCQVTRLSRRLLDNLGKLVYNFMQCLGDSVNRSIHMDYIQAICRTLMCDRFSLNPDIDLIRKLITSLGLTKQITIEQLQTKQLKNKTDTEI